MINVTVMCEKEQGSTDVVINFSDGTSLHFWPFRAFGGAGDVEGLKLLQVKRHGQVLFHYAGQTGRYPQADDHQIQRLSGITQKQVAQYWEIARQHFMRQNCANHLFTLTMVCSAHTVLRALKDGTVTVNLEK